MALFLQTLAHGEWTVVEVKGRVDATTAFELEETLDAVLAKQPRLLALDVRGMDYLSSPGLRVLLTTLKAVTRWGGSLSLVGPTAPVRQVLAVSGLEKIFPVRASLEALSEG